MKNLSTKMNYTGLVTPPPVKGERKRSFEKSSRFAAVIPLLEKTDHFSLSSGYSTNN